MTNYAIRWALEGQLRRLNLLAAGGKITARQKQAQRLIVHWLTPKTPQQKESPQESQKIQDTSTWEP